ncbi:MAG: RagB/SusD family nutrient uptake outer membrane protein [Niabella sp.]
MKYSNKLYTAILVLFIAAGCKKLDLAPTDRFSESNFWTIDANVYNALNNNYSLIYNSGLYFYNEALSDNAFSPSGDVNAIAAGIYTPSLAKFRNDWGHYYATILSCNLFLENIDKNKTLDPSAISRLKLETRFLRAFAHFNLTKWFGEVPLVDRVLTPEEAQTIARASKADVVNFIVRELQAAADSLPSNTQIPQSEDGRITKGAALALQARVLLYQGDKMQEVSNICEALINNQQTNGTYSLNSSYADLFTNPAINKNNPEDIWSLQYIPAERTWTEFFDFAPRSVGGRVSSMAPTQSLVESYIMMNGKNIHDAGSGYDENNPYINRDPRLTATIVYDKFNWVRADGSVKVIYIKPGTDPDPAALDEYSQTSQSSSKTGYYWRKYFDPSALSGFASGLNLHLIRYAEILLNYAEAKNSLGQMNETVWNQTIGALRRRAGFTDPGAVNYPGAGADMTTIIRNERRVELAMEGLRIDDIKRWRVAEITMNGFVHGAKYGDPSVDNGYIRVQQRKFTAPANYLWPIPASERSLNKNLSQNEGY